MRDTRWQHRRSTIRSRHHRPPAIGPLGTPGALYRARLGAVLMLLPFAYMLSTSLKTLGEVFTTPVKWIPKELRWDNYRDCAARAPDRPLFPQQPLRRRLRDPPQPADLLAGRLQLRQVPTIRAANLLFGVVLATMMIPLASMIIPLFMVVRDLRLGRLLLGAHPSRPGPAPSASS